MEDRVIQPWAKELIIGQTVESVSEAFPHGLSIKFTNGTSCHIVAMPFKGGVLDVEVIEGTDAFSDRIGKLKPL
jgi:hypothetical protein